MLRVFPEGVAAHSIRGEQRLVAEQLPRFLRTKSLKAPKSTQRRRGIASSGFHRASISDTGKVRLGDPPFGG